MKIHSIIELFLWMLDFMKINKKNFMSIYKIDPWPWTSNPIKKTFIISRAWNGPGAQVVRPVPGDPNSCEFIWLMDCEYKVSRITIILWRFFPKS